MASATVPAPSGSVRAALIARCSDDSPPGAWQAAAAAAGVAGADAFLCHLSRSIAGAVERLAASAVAARSRLHSVREARAADIVFQSACDELESFLETAYSSKHAALERELCAVDAALEKLRAERDAVTEIAASLNDIELVARHAELTARLGDAESQLLALATTVIEPAYVGLVIDESALLADAAAFGRVVAPRAVTAADLILECAPYRAYPGCTLCPRIVFKGAHHASQTTEELEVSLVAAAVATHVEASLETELTGPQPLQAHISSDTSGRCISISFVVPPTAPIGSSICFGPVTVSGQPVAASGLLGALRVEFVVLAMQPPGPADISPEHAAWLHSQLPPGGSISPSAWEEVYRATIHGFSAAAFHSNCDGRTRLLVLVRAREGGWLFGGFTAAGFISGPERFYADTSAFLFSLTNSLGGPEKLESKRMGADIWYAPSMLAFFGDDLGICDGADTVADSWTWTGGYYAESASKGAHPMARRKKDGWHAAEVVAWAV